MTSQFFIQILNGVGKFVKSDFEEVTSLDISFKDVNIDSLDSLIIRTNLYEIFNIPEDKIKNVQHTTFLDFYNFINSNKQNTPKNLEEALNFIK